MKAKLIFKLPEDQVEFEQCSKASDLAFIIWEFCHNSKKSLIKYADVSEEYETGVEAAYNKLYELLEEYNINLDKLV